MDYKALANEFLNVRANPLQMPVSTARIATLLNHTENKQLIVRIADPDDNRQIIVRLTDTGRSTIQ